MGSWKSSGKDLDELLLTLPVQDLRFLRRMFRVTGGRTKEELVLSILDSGYSAEEIALPTNELLFGLLVEDFVSKAYWAEILVANGLASGGSRHDLLLLLIENGLFDPKGTLEALNPSQLRDVFYDRFNRVLTASPSSGISDLLESFGFGDNARVKPEVPNQQKPKVVAEFNYDVALSFAGEDRSIASQIASGLQAQGIRVFTDDIERTQLWGKDLSDELRSRYGEKTRYVVLLVSRHYAFKGWTDFEFTIARKEAGRRTKEFILPVRLDETPLPGLRSSVVYLSLKEFGVDGIVDEIIRKLKLPL